MNTLDLKALAASVWFDSDSMWVELTDGRQLGVPLAYFPRLAKATATQCKNNSISGGGRGLHWDEIDEDISVPALLAGKIDRTKQVPSIMKDAA